MALGAQIKQLREARGWTLQHLSDVSGVEVGTIHALEARDSARSKFAAPLAAALEVSLEALVGHPPAYSRDAHPTTRLQAQESSHPQLTILPVIPWEDLMRARLPTRFEVLMPDDSMAPRLRLGQPITFSASEIPRPGDGVLVADGSGACYVRIYRQRTVDSWEAHALNEAFAPMDSQRDQLRVLAVLVGVPARWG